MESNMIVGYCAEDWKGTHECVLKFSTSSQQYNDGFECGMIYGMLLNTPNLKCKIRRKNLLACAKIAASLGLSIYGENITDTDSLLLEDVYRYIDVEFRGR